MKAVGIVGSPRKEGNTEIITAHCLRAIAGEGLETELVRMAGLDIRGCKACRHCFENEGCCIEDDAQMIFDKMEAADVIIVGSPVYVSTAPSLLKGLLERAGYLNRQRRMLAGKVGGPLVVARRAGQNFTFAELLLWFHNQGIINPGSHYWNVAFGREKGEVEKDEDGMQAIWDFGKNVAALVKRLKE